MKQMNLVLSVLVRVAAVLYAATTGAALYRVLGTHVAGLSPAQAGILAGSVGLLFQIGLLIAPSTVQRGPRARAVAAVLMVPGLLLFAVIFVGGLRLRPQRASVVGAATIGLVIYAGQYAALWRAHRASTGEPTAAI